MENPIIKLSKTIEKILNYKAYIYNLSMIEWQVQISNPKQQMAEISRIICSKRVN